MLSALNQAFECPAVPPDLMDKLWAAGWRHFGCNFFRYNFFPDNDGVRTITPLRVDLARFRFSKSQRRVLRKNADLRCQFSPATLHDADRAMFDRHKARFKDNIPDSLDHFLSTEPASVPCTCLECRVYLDDQVIALSYLDMGETASSAVYGLFEPAHSQRSLGTYTLLKEIEHALSLGHRYYYPGYATREPSSYDYKKRLSALEELDWETGTWVPLQMNPINM
jgi:arginyl-tRNA--protein-N-Asp/Glu arginylyltransferase